MNAVNLRKQLKAIGVAQIAENIIKSWLKGPIAGRYHMEEAVRAIMHNEGADYLELPDLNCRIAPMPGFVGLMFTPHETSFTEQCPEAKCQKSTSRATVIRVVKEGPTRDIVTWGCECGAIYKSGVDKDG